MYEGGGSRDAGKRFLDLQSYWLVLELPANQVFPRIYTLSIMRGNHTAIVHEPVPD